MIRTAKCPWCRKRLGFITDEADEELIKEVSKILIVEEYKRA